MFLNHYDVIIIGAGLTGLSTAHFLSKKGKKVLVLERTERVGGAMQSFVENGFVFESGPNTGVVSNMETVQLLNDLESKISVEYANDFSKKRYVLKQNEWHALPSGVKSAIKTPLFSLSDKFKILGEPFRKPTKNELETVADMVKRRLGTSFLDYAVDPFVSGIYAGDPEYLVTKFALPKLYALELQYGSFIRGTIKKSKEAKASKVAGVSKKIFSVKGGFGNLIKALVSSVGNENVICSAHNIKVDKLQNIYSVEFFMGDELRRCMAANIVLSTSCKNFSEILPFIDKTEFACSNALEQAKVVEVAIGFNNWTGIALDGFGGLIPRKEKKDVLGILYLSSQFEHRAPDEGALFAAFMGGYSRPDIVEMTDAEIWRILEKTFIELYGLQEFKPDMLKIFRHKTAIPQYGADSGMRFAEIRDIMQRNEGLVLAGNGIGGVGIADRIKQAHEIAMCM